MKGVFFMQKMSKTKKIILSALLLALTIVLSRFLSINTSLLSIGFSFVPIMLAAIWLGPKYAAIICGLADLIRSPLIPIWYILCRLHNKCSLKGNNIWTNSV